MCIVYMSKDPKVGVQSQLRLALFIIYVFVNQTDLNDHFSKFKQFFIQEKLLCG